MIREQQEDVLTLAVIQHDTRGSTHPGQTALHEGAEQHQEDEATAPRESEQAIGGSGVHGGGL